MADNNFFFKVLAELGYFNCFYILLFFPLGGGQTLNGKFHYFFWNLALYGFCWFSVWYNEHTRYFIFPKHPGHSFVNQKETWNFGYKKMSKSEEIQWNLKTMENFTTLISLWWKFISSWKSSYYCTLFNWKKSC